MLQAECNCRYPGPCCPRSKDEAVADIQKVGQDGTAILLLHHIKAGPFPIHSIRSVKTNLESFIESNQRRHRNLRILNRGPAKYYS
jgi:hypothetical protein